MMHENDEFLSMWSDSLSEDLSVLQCSQEPRRKHSSSGATTSFSNTYITHSEQLEGRGYSPSSSPLWDSSESDHLMAAILCLETAPPSDRIEAPEPMPMEASLFHAERLLSDPSPSSALSHTQTATYAQTATYFPAVAAVPMQPIAPFPPSCLAGVMLENSADYSQIEASIRGKLQVGATVAMEPTMLRFHSNYQVPDRINATSPSRLATRARPGAEFTVAVQFIACCPCTGDFHLAAAPKDMRLRAQIWAKRRLPKKARPRKAPDERPFVALTTNPEGAPLLVSGAPEALSLVNGCVEILVKKGSSTGSFEQLSLTCGSNAARSSRASEAARAWDWEYHLLVSQTVHSQEQVSLRPVMSRVITTDSNRSLTREKRKASDDVEPLQPPKKMTRANGASIQLDQNLGSR